MCVYVSMYMYVCICIHIYVCVYMYPCICMCVYVSMYMYVCICIHVYVCVYMYPCICMCVYISMYMYVQLGTLKEFMSEAKNLISILHGTCAMLLKSTLPDQAKPAVFHGIPKIHKLPEIMKTVMGCRYIIDANISDQTTIDIAMEYNILPPVRPIIYGIRCLTENM